MPNGVLDSSHQQMVSSALQWSAEIMQRQHETTEQMRRDPHVLLRPKLIIENEKWYAVYGDDHRYGLVGSGNSPEEAMLAFNMAYYEKLPKKEPTANG